jgi:hypothetical protein
MCCAAGGGGGGGSSNGGGGGDGGGGGGACTHLIGFQPRSKVLPVDDSGGWNREVHRLPSAKFVCVVERPPPVWVRVRLTLNCVESMHACNNLMHAKILTQRWMNTMMRIPFHQRRCTCHTHTHIHTHTHTHTHTQGRVHMHAHLPNVAILNITEEHRNGLRLPTRTRGLSVEEIPRDGSPTHLHLKHLCVVHTHKHTRTIIV